jgi:gamma-F420-2:alpha-L-glutamate ligase
MINGLLLYNRNDYIKNIWLADRFIECAGEFGMQIKLALIEQLTFGLDNNGLFVNFCGAPLQKPKFVINRSRDCIVATQFELLGCRVFNSSRVTDICNNKIKTHQVINSAGVKSVKSFFCSKYTFEAENFDLTYPLIVKSVAGHGGSEVFRADNQIELVRIVGNLPEDRFVMQEMCSNPGIDIRVFVLGQKILGAVRRYSASSFKSNFSLGGKAERYSLTADEKSLVNRVISAIDFDFVGIDFILDKDINMLFNEIEDVVGTRTFYQNYDTDIVREYLGYIIKKL